MLNTLYAGHEKKYLLGGSDLTSFAGIAKVLAEVKSQPLSFTTITAEEYIDGIVSKGTPRHVAEFITS